MRVDTGVQHCAKSTGLMGMRSATVAAQIPKGKLESLGKLPGSVVHCDEMGLVITDKTVNDAVWTNDNLANLGI